MRCVEMILLMDDMNLKKPSSLESCAVSMKQITQDVWGVCGGLGIKGLTITSDFYPSPATSCVKRVDSGHNDE